MPTERVAMRHVREMLRLVREASLTVSDAARRTGVSRSTVREMLLLSPQPLLHHCSTIAPQTTIVENER